MASGYVHVEIETSQSAKHAGSPCGDVVGSDRHPSAVTIVCADGIGSGVRAHLAAEMCKSRLLELLRLGFSLRKAAASVVRTMEQARDPSKPFAAFNVARIRNDGMATVLGYEAPGAILLSPRHASALPKVTLELGGALVAESNCYLEPGEGLLIMSDGITQAGMGGKTPDGWTVDGVVRFLNDRLIDGIDSKEIPNVVHREAIRLWGVAGDDCSAVLALCRKGQIVNLMTGPAAHQSDDASMVRRFIQSEGIKIVCGGSTAEVVARIMRREVRVEQAPKSMIAPPRYEIDGIDLVTEGAVTLNQVYNLLDEDIRNLKEDSGVTELCALLQIADRVNVFMGNAKNKAAGDISFRQRGILTRQQIVPLISQKLRELGKLVTSQAY